MRFSFCLALWCFLSIGCGPQERSLEEMDFVQRDNQQLYYFEGSPFSGLVIDHTDTPARIVYTVNEGVLNGPVTHFNKAEQLVFVEQYSEGKLNGLVESFFSSGVKQYSYHYEAGIKSGPQKLYYPSGQLKKVLSYTAGRLTGDNYLYYSDGKLQYHFHFNAQAQRNGLWEKFYSNGGLKEQITYNNGLLVPPIKRYDPEGNLINYTP